MHLSFAQYAKKSATKKVQFERKYPRKDYIISIVRLNFFSKKQRFQLRQTTEIPLIFLILELRVLLPFFSLHSYKKSFSSYSIH